MTLLEPDLLDEAAQAYGDGWRLLADGTDQALSDLWYELGGLGDADLARWEAAMEELLVPAQEAAAGNAAAWLDVQAGYAGATTLPPPQPYLLQTPAALGEGPIVRMRTLVGQGMEYPRALDDVAGMVRRVGSTLMRYSEVAGRSERDEQVAPYMPEGYHRGVGGRLVKGERKVLAYKRVPGPRACAWCIAVATPLYSQEGVAGSWHSHCDCTWRLAMPQDVSGTLDGGAWRDTPLGDTSRRRAQKRAARVEQVRAEYQARGDYWRQRAIVTPDQEAETRYVKRAEAWWAKAAALR